MSVSPFPIRVHFVCVCVCVRPYSFVHHPTHSSMQPPTSPVWCVDLTTPSLPLFPSLYYSSIPVLLSDPVPAPVVVVVVAVYANLIS